MGKITISMAIFNSYVTLPEGMVGMIDLVHKYKPWTLIDVG